MPTLLELLNDPNYTGANAATKQAIFDKYSANDDNYLGANEPTKQAIRSRFGIEDAASLVSQIPGAALGGGFVPSGEKGLPWGDIVAGNPVTRFALGAASPFLGITQFGDNGPDLKQLESMKRRGMKLSGDETDLLGFAGTVFSPAFLAAAKAIPGATTYIGKILQGMGIGAGAGLTTPVTEEGDFASKKAIQTGVGAAGGATISAIAPFLAKTGKIAYSAAIEPWLDPAAIKGRAFLDAAGGKADEIIALLRGNKEIVPGSLPTAGEAAVPAGRSEFAALQRSASNVKPSDYLARADEQNAARMGAVRGVGQDEVAIKAAKDARDAAATPLYESARAQSVKADGFLKSMLARPSMNKALSRAEELAREQAQQFAIGKDKPASEVVSKILNASGQPAFSTIIPASAAEYPVASLHNIKMALDDMVKNPERFSIGASEVNAINNTRKSFLSWLGNKVPEYDAARMTYAQKSKPINQMEIGQYLESKLVPALSDDAKQKAATYATALRDAPGTIKRATGTPRFDKLMEVLTPDQVAIVNSVRDDLARGARFEAMASKGAKAAPNAIQLASGSMEQEAGGKIPNLLHRGAMVANAIITRLEGKVNSKLAAEMASEMLYPAKVATSLTQARMQEARNKSFAAAIQRYLLSTTGGVIQAIDKSYEQSQQ